MLILPGLLVAVIKEETGIDPVALTIHRQIITVVVEETMAMVEEAEEEEITGPILTGNLHLHIVVEAEEVTVTIAEDNNRTKEKGDTLTLDRLDHLQLAIIVVVVVVEEAITVHRTKVDFAIKDLLTIQEIKDNRGTLLLEWVF